VVNVSLISGDGKVLDTYLHFKRDSIWKVAAFRSLAMTDIIAKVNYELSVLTPRQVDSIIAAPHKKNMDTRLFASMKEYQYTLGNTGLVLASDKQLIDYFNKNKSVFEKLKDDLIAKGIMSTAGGVKDMKDAELFSKQVKALLLNSVGPDKESSKNNLDFSIGGILDNTVGFLYIRNEKDVPKMTPGGFIMVKKIADGWYLYKTT
jgi:hypothetical protein